MAYILKDAQGKIIAVSAIDNLGENWVFIDDTSREYLDFLEGALEKGDPFRESDIRLARVLEDLITLLIERNTIRFTDLPHPAQKRLNDRESMRNKTQSSTILDDSTNIFFDI